MEEFQDEKRCHSDRVSQSKKTTCGQIKTEKNRMLLDRSNEIVVSGEES